MKDLRVFVGDEDAESNSAADYDVVGYGGV